MAAAWHRNGQSLQTGERSTERRRHHEGGTNDSEDVEQRASEEAQEDHRLCATAWP